MTMEESLNQAKSLTKSDPKNALVQWEKLVEEHPYSEEAHLGKAECYRALGQTDEAVVIYENLVREKPNSFGALVGLGQISLNNENWIKVEEMFGIISQSFENVPWSFVHQASARSALGKPEDALAILATGLKKNDKSGIILDKLVQILCDMDREQQALEAFKQIITDNLVIHERQQQLASRLANVFFGKSGFPKTAFDLDETLLAFFRYDPADRRK